MAHDRSEFYPELEDAIAELAKELGPLEALTIGVGTMIGAGIFVLPSVAAEGAGPAASLAFLVGGIIALFTALSASELGTAMPKAGGSYYFVNHALGPLFGCIAGWGNWIGLAFASAFYCVGFGDYVISWAPIPEGWTLSLGLVTMTPDAIAALAAGALFVGVNYIGAKETGRLQNAIVITLVAILTVFITAGLFRAESANLVPFFGGHDWTAILPTTGVVFVSFLGFAQITTVAEEIRNPGNNLPLAIIGSVVLVTVIYVVVMLMLTSATDIPLPELGEVAVVEVGGMVLGAFGVVILTVGGLLATASSANASILASSRINFAMGRDKLITNWLNDIHDRFATPHRSIAVTGGLILGFILIFGNDPKGISYLAKAGSVLHLVVYGAMNLALLVMRTADPPEYDPDFTVPFYPVVPILGVVTSFGLIGFMDPFVQKLSLGFVALGVVWYFAYARRHTEKRGIFGMYFLDRAVRQPEGVSGAADIANPESEKFRVMVPLAHPEHEKNLISIASAFAKQRNGTVVAVHIVQVPDQTPLHAGAEHIDELDQSSKMLLEKARDDAETFGVDVETHTIMSHRSFEEVFDAARTQAADLAILGWGGDSHGAPGRVESALDDLTGTLPCDFIVFKDLGFDPDRILLPTRGGPDSDVSAQIAHVLGAEYDTELTLLHIVDDESERERGTEFLADWAAQHGIEDAEHDIAVSDDPYAAIAERAPDHTLLILGATEKGILRRLAERRGVAHLMETVDRSVLLAERARTRGLFERIFGGS